MNDSDSKRVCPTCGRPLNDRVSDKPGRDSRGYSYEPGVGKELGSGFSTDVTWFHYIPLTEISEWEATGWAVSELDSHHSRYSVLGKWMGPGAPVMPKGSPS